jgi:hypothetical protein
MVAEHCGVLRQTIMLATSSVVAAQQRGAAVFPDERVDEFIGGPGAVVRAGFGHEVAGPSDVVGPGRQEPAVAPVPAHSSTRPRGSTFTRSSVSVT